MRAGLLRHRVVIQKLDGTRDALGAEVQNWTDLATHNASVEPLDGRELESAKRIQADITTKVTTRYFTLTSTLTSKMRIKFGTRLYDILSIQNPDYRNKELQFMCKERI